MKRKSFFDEQIGQLDRNLEWWLTRTIPTEDSVNHFSRDYATKKTVLNGKSKGVSVTQVFKDDEVQELFIEVEAGGYIPIHDHADTYCVIKVVKGCIYDPVNDQRYVAGDIIRITPRQKHGVICAVDTSYVTWNTPDGDVADYIYHTGRYRAKTISA